VGSRSPASSSWKALITWFAATLATDAIVEVGHRVLFVSGDNTVAYEADLAKKLGFAPVKLGKFNEGATPLWVTFGSDWPPKFSGAKDTAVVGRKTLNARSQIEIWRGDAQP
jgi:predicted dinucleotide-binding enzyme